MVQTIFKNIFKMREHASRRRPGADEGFDAHEKPFLDHLEDLRHTLIRIASTLSISTIACFAFHKQIFQLVQYPAKVKLAEISPGVSLWDKLELITLGPTEFIVLMLKLSFFSGLIITFPFTIYFLFQFLLPGLREVEKRAIIPGAGIGFVLFMIGASFAFFGAAPIALKYFYIFENERISNLDPAAQALERPIGEFALIGFDGEKIPPVGTEVTPPPAESPDAAPAATTLTPELRQEIRQYLLETFTTAEGANFALRHDEARDKLVIVAAKGGKSSYQIGKYISFISQLVLVFGISFQMPIVVSILVRLELLTARVMRETRTYAWIIILVAAAILTPPDILTLGLLGGPLIFLYELCIIIASIMERKVAKKQRAEEEKNRSRLEQLYLKPAAELSEEEKAELHKAEIEQYEREHKDLFLEESQHIARDGFHGDDSGTQHDESWHEDDHYWHEEHHHDPHAGMESDHAEIENLEPGAESEDMVNDHTEEQTDSSVARDFESCVPDGPVVDLNFATEEELITLPGIGPKLAKVIISHRPFHSFDDLDLVPGLGEEKIRRITDRIMMG